LAREGKTVSRKARRITIFALKLLDFSGDQLTLDVGCSKGTYIRSLAEDIGFALGCCATVTALRRLEAGRFSIADARCIEELAEMDEHNLLNSLIAVDQPLVAIPAVQLSDEQTKCISCGQSVQFQEALPGMVRMYHEAVFLGLGERLLDGRIAPKKLFNMNDV